MPDAPERRNPSPWTDEEGCRLIADNIREIFWIYDSIAQRVLYLNAAYERVTGRPVADVYEKPLAWFEALHPRDRARVEEAFRKIRRSYNIEYRIVRPDGEVRWIWTRGASVQDADGGALRVVGVAADITDRKDAEQALKRSLSLLRATLDATADGIMALDLNGRPTIFNRRFVELWRLPEFQAADPAKRRRLWAGMTEQLEHPEQSVQPVHRIHAQPETDSFDVLEFKDGRVFERYSRPQRIDDDVVGRVWSFRDSTGRIRAERELRQHTRRLEIYDSVLLRLARHRVAGPEGLNATFRDIAEAAAEMLETERVGIWRFEHGRDRIRASELYERSRSRHSDGALVSFSDAPAYFAALADERAIAAGDARKDARTCELTDSYLDPLGITSMLDAPIRAGGELAGIVCFEHVGPPRDWTAEEQSFAGSVADLVSVALEAAQRQRVEADLRLLAQASSTLVSSLDYRPTLANVAQLALPVLADQCVIDVVEDGRIQRVASTHRDPEKDALLRELTEHYPLSADSLQPGAVALRTEEPHLVRDVTDEDIRAISVDDKHYRLLRGLGVSSYMAVPLEARGHVIGAITLAMSGRSYEDHDLAIARDLADRAALAIDNALLHRDAQEASKSKSDFLAVMSHELRTPLNAIMGYAELLDSETAGPVTPAQKDQLQRIHLRSLDLLHIVEEILAYSRTESGRDRIRTEIVDVRALIDEVSAVARPLAEEKGLGFDATIDHAAPFPTDRGKLKHVLLDLLSNAVRFTDRGKVRMDASVNDGSAEFRIQDTGRGIPTADQRRIFEPFSQIDDPMTRETGGTGLGLAVVKRFVDILGGTISVESAPGRGSTFTVELPAGGSAGTRNPAPRS